MMLPHVLGFLTFKLGSFLRRATRRLSNTMDVEFCIDAVQDAVDRWGASAIFNTNQGNHLPAMPSHRCASARA